MLTRWRQWWVRWDRIRQIRNVRWNRSHPHQHWGRQFKFGTEIIGTRWNCERCRRWIVTPGLPPGCPPSVLPKGSAARVAAELVEADRQWRRETFTTGVLNKARFERGYLQ